METDLSATLTPKPGQRVLQSTETHAPLLFAF